MSQIDDEIHHILWKQHCDCINGYSQITEDIKSLLTKQAEEILDYINKSSRWKAPKGLTSLWLWRGDWEDRILKYLYKKHEVKK